MEDFQSYENDEDQLVVEFAPYDLGSYAAGFIEISIPYEELGLELY